MLTQLSTVKSRLNLTDTQYDTLLTTAIAAVGARFDKECRRALARTENLTQEFAADDTEILVTCYPVESVLKFETKASEAEGWLEQPLPDFLIRSACIISLRSCFSPQPLAFSLCRVTYTGGYVLPGTSPAAGQTALPADLEQAAVEQVAFWFQNREHVGVMREWPKGGTYEQFADLDLIPSVRAVLTTYRRCGA